MEESPANANYPGKWDNGVIEMIGGPRTFAGMAAADGKLYLCGGLELACKCGRLSSGLAGMGYPKSRQDIEPDDVNSSAWFDQKIEVTRPDYLLCPTYTCAGDPHM